MSNICVFMSAGFGHHDDYVTQAIRLAEVLVESNFNLIYGGASVGLMGVMADAILERKGNVIGVMSKALAHQEITHTRLTALHLVDTMQERKHRMATLADAFIVFPGGLGTLEEAFEVWNALKIGLHAKPMGFLNVGGYFDGLFSFLQGSVDAGFIKKEQLQLVTLSSCIHDLVHQLKQKIENRNSTAIGAS